MPTLTLSIPEDLKREMDAHKIINWSEVAREAIRERLESLKILQSITAKSKLTEKDALTIGRKIRHGIHRRLMKESPEYRSALSSSGKHRKATPPKS